MNEKELLRAVELLESKIQDLVWKFEDIAMAEVHKINISTSDADDESAIPIIEVVLLEDAGL